MIRISPLLLLILVSFTDHVDSVVLTSVSLTAIDGELFTMICSSNTTGESIREWHRSGVLVFYTTKGSSSLGVSNPDVFNMYLVGRISVSCDVLQHNVTLRINSAIDNRSWWTCFDNLNSQTSNTMTINAVMKSQLSPTTTTVILFTKTTPLFGTEKETSTATSPSSPTTDVVNLTTVSSTTTIAATSATTATTTTTATTANFDISTSTSLQAFVCPLCKDAPNVVYIAVGAASGGVVVGCVITIIVGIIWMRRRNTSKEDDASAPNIYTSPSHYEDMGHQYGKVERQYVNTVEGIGSGSPDSTEDRAGNAAYYNTAGQHQHRDEDANTGDGTYYNTAREQKMKHTVTPLIASFPALLSITKRIDK